MPNKFGSAEHRGHQSERMKVVWAKRRAGLLLPIVQSPISAACREQLSARMSATMRRVWDERRRGVLPPYKRKAKPPVPRQQSTPRTRPAPIVGSGRWTPESRAKQAAAIKRWAPWRTGGSKPGRQTRSRFNAWKHGLRSAVVAEVVRLRREIKTIVREAA